MARGSPSRTVFLDLYGVVANSRLMVGRYRQRMAEILHRDFGLPVDRWLRIHDEAWVWYTREGGRLDALPPSEREGPGWVEAVNRMEAGHIEFVFARAGLPPPEDRDAFSHALEAEIIRGVDALYPDARPALRDLKARGHRLYLSTNARRANAESALLAGGVRDAFDGLVALEVAAAKKDRPSYWRRAFDLAGVRPSEAVAVDDVARFLTPAATLGARCVQVVRPTGEPAPRGPYPVIPSLSALPGLLASPQGRTRSRRR